MKTAKRNVTKQDKEGLRDAYRMLLHYQKAAKLCLAESVAVKKEDMESIVELAMLALGSFVTQVPVIKK
jgi:hypothetical protein